MKFTISFFLILLSFGAISQIEVGVRGGVAFSKQKYDIYNYPPNFSDNLLGVETGMMFNWFFLHNFFLQPELTFIQKGGDYFRGAIKINQIEIAALTGYEKKFKHLSVFANSGLFVDRVINKVKVEGGPLRPSLIDAVKDNNWGWGLLHSGGIAMPIRNSWIGLMVRYRYSLNYFRKTYGNDVDGNPTTDSIANFKNRTWGITITYKIEI